MSVTIEQDLKEILLKIDKKIDRIDERLNNLEIGQIRLEGEIKRVEGELKGEIKLVDEKMLGINKRLEFQEFINRGVLIGFIVTILGGLAKMFGFVGNP